tara:strand:- start:540 stop:1289 length:750 start_codon:yes stop_codon:yes gene_type:complete
MNFIKDIEFFLKKIIPEKIQLQKRLKRAIKNGYEKELNLIKKFGDKKKSAIDVGVYRGVYSYEMSKYFNFVYGFEPNPIICPYLMKHLTKIIKNMCLYNMALSNKTGSVNLRVPKRNNSIFKNNFEELFRLGCATIHEKNTFNDFEKFNVKVDKLDNIIKNKDVGLIKIDVEGHEIEVINGAKKIINENKPILLVEIEEKHTKNDVQATIDKINQLGYQSFFFEDNQLRNTKNLSQRTKCNNFIFINKN